MDRRIPAVRHRDKIAAQVLDLAGFMQHVEAADQSAAMRRAGLRTENDARTGFIGRLPQSRIDVAPRIHDRNDIAADST